MLVSFIIVALNASNRLDSIFADIRKQDYPHEKIQIILVDSLSSDNTKQKMLDFKSAHEGEFHSVRVLENPKKILPAGWNIALRTVQGDVVLRVDAHSHIPADFISENVKQIARGEKIVGGPRKSIIDQENKWQKVLLEAETSLFGSGIAKYRNSETTQYVSTLAHAAYKREVFEEVGGYDERLARTEDNEIHYRMKQAGFKFLFSTNIKSFHHSRNSFAKMLKQKYSNGKWIGLTLGVSPKCFSVYHFVPFLFVLAILFSVLFAVTVSWLPFALLAGAYALVDAMLTLFSILRNKFALEYLSLPFIFLALHLAYGLGTLVGVLQLPFWKKRSENESCEEIKNIKNDLKARFKSEN